MLFTAKVFLFLVLLFAVDRVVGISFVKIKDLNLKKNPENEWVKTPFVVEKVYSDVVIIGSSKASHHYIPQILSDSLGMTVYNCGQDGCFFLYQNCIINMLLDRYNPKLIIWDIQPSSFVGGGRAEEYQNIRYLSPYYSKNKWAKSYIDSESSKMPIKMQSRMFAYNSKVLNYLFPLVAAGAKTDYGYIPLPKDGYNYPQKLTQGYDSLKSNKNEYYLHLLSDTLKRCKEQGVEIRLFASPEYTYASTPYKTAVNDISDVTNNYSIVFYDNHSFAGNDSTFFKDVNHLNDKGATIYTSLIIESLNL